ncbi:hypothetical protein GCM10009674_04530 [Nesterenkonia xinjiangensis]
MNSPKMISAAWRMMLLRLPDRLASPGPMTREVVDGPNSIGDATSVPSAWTFLDNACSLISVSVENPVLGQKEVHTSDERDDEQEHPGQR